MGMGTRCRALLGGHLIMDWPIQMTRGIPFLTARPSEGSGAHGPNWTGGIAKRCPGGQVSPGQVRAASSGRGLVADDLCASGFNKASLCASPLAGLGPLHTRAESHDHEIVRAQKKSVQRSSQHTPKSCSVVTGPQVLWEVVCDRALNQILFQ